MNKLPKIKINLERSQGINTPNFNTNIHNYIKKGYKPIGKKIPSDIDEIRIKHTLRGEVH